MGCSNRQAVDGRISPVAEHGVGTEPRLHRKMPWTPNGKPCTEAVWDGPRDGVPYGSEPSPRTTSRAPVR